jgi:hypothetical protein
MDIRPRASPHDGGDEVSCAREERDARDAIHVTAQCRNGRPPVASKDPAHRDRAFF